MQSAETIHEGYTQLLLRQPWHWTGTFTFAPGRESVRAGVHPESADKAFRFFVSSLNREIWGPRWAKKPHGGIIWARGQEYHKSGRIHHHAVFAGPTFDLNSEIRRLTWMDWWYRHFGIARLERPRSQNDVSGYVSKYVTKGGEVDLSANFGRYQPPSLFVAG